MWSTVSCLIEGKQGRRPRASWAVCGEWICHSQLPSVNWFHDKILESSPIFGTMLARTAKTRGSLGSDQARPIVVRLVIRHEYIHSSRLQLQFGKACTMIYPLEHLHNAVSNVVWPMIGHGHHDRWTSETTMSVKIALQDWTEFKAEL